MIAKIKFINVNKLTDDRKRGYKPTMIYVLI